jgi:hypothetical protein
VWLRVSLATGALLGATGLILWAQQRPPSCTASFEASRQLQLSRATDREHLAADSASATRTAHRYVAADADTPERQHRFLDCETRLFDGVAAVHGVPVAAVRASAAGTE